jgi:hypothetical protein
MGRNRTLCRRSSGDDLAELLNGPRMREWSCKHTDSNRSTAYLALPDDRPGERRCAHQHGSSLAAWNQRQHDLAV